MRALLVVSVAIVSLSACSNEAADAERELAVVEKAHGSADEICAAQRNVAQAYLKAQNSAKYESTKLAGEIKCQSARLDENDRQADDLGN